MNRFAMILAVVILPAWVLPAPADGIFGLFGKKTKVNASERVPQLIVILKTDQDERKRASAATELGTFDAVTFAEIVPVLIDVLQHDPKSGVRMDAASSLASLRPVSQAAGQALEKAVSSDDNWRARWHAKGLLMKYRIAGYSPGSAPGPNGPKTIEPPLLSADAYANPPIIKSAVRPPAQFPTGPSPFSETSMSRTPATASNKDDTPVFRPSIPRPLPLGPAFSTAVPQQAAQPVMPGLPVINSEGPPLTPLPSPPPQPSPPPVSTPVPPAPF